MPSIFEEDVLISSCILQLLRLRPQLHKGVPALLLGPRHALTSSPAAHARPPGGAPSDRSPLSEAQDQATSASGLRHSGARAVLAIVRGLTVGPVGIRQHPSYTGFTKSLFLDWSEVKF